MRIIKPTFEELSNDNLYKKIEICGRVCYKSEDKITDTSALNFVKKICVNNHGSVLEHFALTFKVSEEFWSCNITYRSYKTNKTNILYNFWNFYSKMTKYQGN